MTDRPVPPISLPAPSPLIPPPFSAQCRVGEEREDQDLGPSVEIIRHPIGSAHDHNSPPCSRGGPPRRIAWQLSLPGGPMGNGRTDVGSAGLVMHN
jgi:hypothetical protein